MPDLVGRAIEGVAASGPQDKATAFGREPFRAGPAETRRGATNESVTTLKPQVHSDSSDTLGRPILPSLPPARYPRRMIDRIDVIDRAVAAYRALGELGETVEDEWQYVVDLTEAYETSLEALAAGEPLSEAAAAAVDEAIEEIGLITDPHKGIDWLSTFPHVVALAVGGDVDGQAEGGAGAEANEPAQDEDDDSPFRALLRRGR
jgi:hypothetical protein